MKKYLIGSAIALSLVIGAGAQSAQALTQAEATAIISALNLSGTQAAAIQGLVSAPAVSTPVANFSRSLTIGSSGSDVSALQSFLVSKGYLTMPAGVAMGYFGSLTRTALAQYQAAEGISPAAGYFGPITIAHINASGSVTTGGSVSTVPGCTAGALFSSTTGAACNGSMTPVPGNGTGSVVSDGTDGSATASLSSYVGTGTQIKKGESKDLIAVKLQATAGSVSVTRFDARFNTRPWLYFSQLTLKDTNGNVVATKNLSNASDVTEVSVGTDYLVRFDNVNAVVTPGSDRTFVVSGTVLSTTDKLSSDVSVTVSVPDGSIRTVNGKGYTDSLGDTTFTRTVTLLSTGSQGDITVRISPSTPAQGIVTTSKTNTTNDVILGSYDFKAGNQPATINTLNFALNSSAGARSFPTMFKNLRLYDGSTVYNVDAIAGSTGLASSTNTFTNLNITIPQDQWKTLTLKADVSTTADTNPDVVSGVSASSSIQVNAGNIKGIDTNYNNATVAGSAATTGGTTVAGNNVTFLVSGASITNQSVSVVANNNGTSRPVTANVKFTFTLNNTSSNDLYVAGNPSIALATSSSFTVATTSFSTLNTQLNPTTISGDVVGTASNDGAYKIQAGSSRTFTYQGLIQNTGGASANTGILSVTKVYFTDDTSNMQKYNINFGLEGLKTDLTTL